MISLVGKDERNPKRCGDHPHCFYHFVFKDALSDTLLLNRSNLLVSVSLASLSGSFSFREFDIIIQLLSRTTCQQSRQNTKQYASKTARILVSHLTHPSWLRAGGQQHRC